MPHIFTIHHASVIAAIMASICEIWQPPHRETYFPFVLTGAVSRTAVDGIVTMEACRGKRAWEMGYSDLKGLHAKHIWFVLDPHRCWISGDTILQSNVKCSFKPGKLHGKDVKICGRCKLFGVPIATHKNMEKLHRKSLEDDYYSNRATKVLKSK